MAIFGIQLNAHSVDVKYWAATNQDITAKSGKKMCRQKPLNITEWQTNDPCHKVALFVGDTKQHLDQKMILNTSQLYLSLFRKMSPFFRKGCQTSFTVPF